MHRNRSWPRRRTLIPLLLAGGVLAGCATVPTEPAPPDLTRAAVSAAQAAEAGGNPSQAAIFYGNAYQKGVRDPQTVVGYARNLRNSGDPARAVLVVREALRQSPDDVALLTELGRAALAGDYLDEAEMALQRAVSRPEAGWEAHMVMGIAQTRRTSYAAAEEAFNKALSLSPNNLMVMSNLALSQAEAGRLDDAIAVMERVVRQPESTPRMRLNLALLYGLKGDTARAERLSAPLLPPEALRSNLAWFRDLHDARAKK